MRASPLHRVASIEANQAAVLSACGQGQRAEALFAAALERIRTSAVALEEEEEEQGQQGQGQGGEARAEEQSNLFMVQVRHANPNPNPDPNPIPNLTRPTPLHGTGDAGARPQAVCCARGGAG